MRKVSSNTWGISTSKTAPKAVVVVRPKGIADVLEKFSRKADKDVLKEFLDERR